jgi:hypothetical protein
MGQGAAIDQIVRAKQIMLEPLFQLQIFAPIAN